MGSPDLWLWLAAITLIVVGIAGTLLPALPGAPLVLGGLLLAAWIDDFREVGYVTLTVLGALTLVTVVVDIAAAMMGAQRVGATRAGVIGSALGTIVGMFLGFAGLVIGPFVGALIGELSARRGCMLWTPCREQQREQRSQLARELRLEAFAPDGVEGLRGK